MERFVRLVTGGGLALVAGLWIVALTSRWSTAWALGTALALVGVAALALGIGGEIRIRT